MSWNIEGSYFENCSCDVVCPCTASLTLGATDDRCNAMLVFNVKSGDVERAPISVQENGLSHAITIGDAIDVEVEDVVPFGVETGEPAKLAGIFHPAGTELNVARTTRSKINAFGITYEGKSAFSTSRFSWSA